MFEWRIASLTRGAKRGKPIKASTARRELVVLGAALRWCWKEAKLDRLVPVTLPAQARSAPASSEPWRGGGFARRGARLGPVWRPASNKISRHLARIILVALYTGTRHDASCGCAGRRTRGAAGSIGSGVMYRRASGAVDKGKRRPPVPITPRLLPHLLRWRRFATTHVIEYAGRPINSQGAEGVADGAGARRIGRLTLRRMSYGTPAPRCCCNSE